MMRALRAAWIRGGTSKGLYFHARDLPPHGHKRDALILAALGSPDPSGLQLNGVGGGISSTSKVAIVARSEREGYDVDYLFGQVEIKDRRINWEGSCGNLSAGVGLFSLGEGLVEAAAAGAIDEAVQHIRVWQVNQGYAMNVHVPSDVDRPLHKGEAARSDTTNAAKSDLFALAGVPGKEPAIYVQLLEPHGDKPLLPSGRPVDVLSLPNGDCVEATLVTAGNPTVIVHAETARLSGSELPGEMDYATILPLVEHLREQAASLMGVARPSDQPRVAFVSSPRDYTTSAGDHVNADAAHILSRISTPGRIHHAHTGTGSIALACASRVEGSVPWRCMQDGVRPAVGEALRIGHPGGIMEVRADVVKSDCRGWHATGAGFDRTARYLMRGHVFVPIAERAA